MTSITEQRMTTGRRAEAAVTRELEAVGFTVTNLNDLVGNCPFADLLANKRLTNMLAAVVAELEAAHAQSDRLDNIAEGYSEALAQLIIPDGPRDAS